MSDTHMDKAAREKARELCEKATPGPWVSEHEVTGRVPDAGCGIVASDDHTKISNPSRGIVAWACRLVSRTNAETKANAAFVAAARTLLPQALDALDAADSDNARLQARVSELEAAVANEREECAKIVEARLLVKEDCYGESYAISPTNEQRATAIRTRSILPAPTALKVRSKSVLDPRDPDLSREGIFRDHNCWKCQSGRKPCVNGSPNRCEYPHARND